ncbi:MAG: protein phosphatase 2C domain-containing protein [Candidatus Heimdallarchaeota archaeon]|nr:protein phosphatase 2C domain-containing protein [Candidatus Heimdallarchaeota archaeon]
MRKEEMDFQKRLYLLGRDYPNLGVVKQANMTFDTYSISVALSCGKTTHEHQYGRPNEDSVGFVKDGDVSVAVIADSHFGGVIADAMVLAFIEDFHIYSDDLIKLVGYSHEHQFREVSTVIRRQLEYAMMTKLPEIRDGKQVGESTVIICIMLENELFYFSMGDSMLYIKTNNTVRMLEQNNFSFITRDLHTLPHFITDYMGYEKLPDSYTLLLITDGFPGIYGNPPPECSVVSPYISEISRETASNIINHCWSLGAQDNLGIIVIQSSY